MIDPQSWRRPGCDERCQSRTVIATGALRRISEPVHDPDAHEEYGASLVAGLFQTVVKTGPLVVNLRDGTTQLAGRYLKLTEREWLVLSTLAEAAGRVVSTPELLSALWPGVDPEGSSPHTVRVWIGRIRARLGSACSLIVNEHSRGYRLQMLPPSNEMPDAPWRRWARNYDACVRCGTTDRQHDSRGRCVACRDAAKPRRGQQEAQNHA